MPNFINPSDDRAFLYDNVTSSPLTAASSAQTFVSTVIDMFHSELASIILNNSTTANFTVWANNSKEFNHFVPTYMANLDVNYGGNSQILDGTFQSNWINITNHPIVMIADKAFYINTTFRFIRLQGSGVTASCSGDATKPIGWLWSHNNEAL